MPLVSVGGTEVANGCPNVSRCCETYLYKISWTYSDIDQLPGKRFSGKSMETSL